MNTRKNIQKILALCLIAILIAGCKPIPAATEIPLPDGQATEPVASIQPSAPQRIIFQSNRSGDAEIYAINADGSGLVNLTNNPAWDSYPTCSPDGQYIAFLSDRDGQKGVYLMNTDGSNQRFLAATSVYTNTDIAWSPDSTRLAYIVDNADEQDIHVINIDGTGERNITNSPGVYMTLSWSADGQRLAYIFATRDYPVWNIYSIAVDGSDLQLLVEDATGPLWSPDGMQVVYTQLVDQQSELFIMNADASGELRLTDDPERDDNTFWSPDGTQIGFISRRTGEDELYLINVDGSNLRQLTTIPVSGTGQDHEGSSWSPDGTQIAFMSEENGNYDLYVINVDGSGLVRLTDDPGIDILPSWQPTGGSTITPASDGTIVTPSNDGKAILFEDNFDGTELNADLWDFVSYPGDASYTISDGILHIPSGESPDGSIVSKDARSKPGFHPENSMLVFETRLRLDSIHMSTWGLIRQDEQGVIGFVSTRDSQFAALVKTTTEDYNKFILEGVDLTEWHTYRIELSATQVSFYVDDGLMVAADISLVAGKPWSILLDSATNNSNQATNIDYVRLNQSGAQAQEDGQPQVEPVSSQRDVKIDGWVDNPTILDLDSFRAQELVTINVELPQGGLHTYTGLPLYYILLSIVQIQPDADTLIITSSDGISAEVDIQNLIESCANCLLAYEEQDGFFVAVMPGYPNELWLKDVIQLNVTK